MLLTSTARISTSPTVRLISKHNVHIAGWSKKKTLEKMIQICYEVIKQQGGMRGQPIS